MPKQGRPTKAAMVAETMEEINLEAPLPGEVNADAEPNPGLPLDDPRVQEMEIELRTLYQESNRDLISNVVKIGKHLGKAKELIAGRYQEWLPRTGMSQSTASRYVRISRFVTANPEINRWKELGLNRILLLGRIPSENLPDVLDIPRKAEILRMTDETFLAHVTPYIPDRAKRSVSQQAAGYAVSFRSSRERLVAFRSLVTKNPGLELPESVVAEYFALKKEVEALGGLVQA